MIDLASMVLAPTAVKDGKVYNAIPNDQDFTFSRGTEATRINSAGLIEKARTNYLLQSNSFDTTWTTDNTSVTSGQSGYDGSNDAWRLTKTANQYAKLVQSISNSNLQTYSFYVKADTLDYAIIYIDASTDVAIWIDLTDGSITNTLRDDFVVSKKVENISNGWYRCSITTNQSVSQVRIFPNDTQTTYGTTSGSIYIQSAQLEQGLIATDYIPTTTSSVTVGVTDDLPRVDYSGGGCPSLLLEPSRTNALPHSEYFGTWTKNNATVDFGYLAPDGTNSAYKLTDSGSGLVYYAGVVDSNHSRSIYARTTSGTGTAQLLTHNSNTNNTFTITEEWQRFEVSSLTSSIADTTFYAIDFRGSATLSEIIVWGAQSEASASYVSSYIPTYGTSTSRSADSCSLTNASNLIGQTEGTMFGEFFVSDIVTAGSYVRTLVNDGSSVNQIAFFYYPDGRIQATASVGGSIVVSINIPSYGLSSGKHKFAFAYKLNDYVLFVDGVNVGVDTSATVPSMSVFNLYDTSGGSMSYNQAILFPTRLTNDQLAELTK